MQASELFYHSLFLAASILPRHTSCKEQEKMTNRHLRIGIKGPYIRDVTL